MLFLSMLNEAFVMNIKKTLLILLPILAFTVSACGSASSSSSSDPISSSESSTSYANPKESFSFKIKEKANRLWGLDEDAVVEFDFKYNDDYFFIDATKRNDDLGLLSLGMAGVNGTKETINNFFNAIHYTKIYNSPSYDNNTYHSIAYTIAQKTVEDYVIVATSVRGFYYGLEMVGNFFLGSSGDHQDFSQAMEKVYSGLSDYLAKEVASGSKVKLWLAGYSRAAAVTNLLSKHVYDKALEGTLKGVDKNDIYAYCFETPSCTVYNGQESFSFIHNYMNSRDFITFIPPKQYGFKVYGDVIDIYQENVAEIVKNFDSRLIYTEFKPYYLSLDLTSEQVVEFKENPKGEKDIKKFVEGIMVQATEKLSDYDVETAIDLSTRTKYVNTAEKHIEPTADLVRSITPEQFEIILPLLKEKGSSIALALLASNYDKLLETVKGILDEAAVTYEEEELCSLLTDLGGVLAHYLGQYLKDMTGPCVINSMVTMVKNIIPIIGLHLLETSYSLMKYLIANK